MNVNESAEEIKQLVQDFHVSHLEYINDRKSEFW